MNIVTKKYFADSRLSIVVVVAVVLLVLVYQFSIGARIVYFLPDYPVTRSVDDLVISPSDESLGPYYGFEKCHFYGSCLNLAGKKDLDFVYPLFWAILFYFAFIAGLEKTWIRKFLGLVLAIASYWIVASAQELDWFYRCSDFCGIEHLFMWAPLLVVYMFGIATTFFLKRRVTKMNPREKSSNVS